jgi:hypothetical protein
MTDYDIHILSAAAYARALRTGGDVALWAALVEEQSEVLEQESEGK